MNIKLIFRFTLILIIVFSSSNMKAEEIQFEGALKFHENDEEANIFVIHGIGIHGQHFADEFLCHFARFSGFTLKKGPVENVCPSPFYDDKDAIVFPENYTDFEKQSSVQVVELSNKNQNARLKKIKCIIVHWSPITYPYKVQLFDQDESPKRWFFVNTIKHSLLNRGLGDVSLFFNQSVKLSIFKTIDFALSKLDTTKKLNKFSIVSASFGSKIFFDFLNQVKTDELAYSSSFALAESKDSLLNSVFYNPLDNDSLVNGYRKNQENLTTENTNQIIQDLLNRTEMASKCNVNFYMLTNQIPLLNMGDVYSVNKSYSDSTSVKAYHPTIKYFIFNDPNDLLGYKILDPALLAMDGYQVQYANIQMRNALSIFGFSNPIKAHTGAFTNKRLIKMIVHGKK